MLNRYLSLRFCLIFSAVFAAVMPALSGEPVRGGADSALPQQDTRYGLFNLLDHRSAYGEGVFPEPLLIDDTNLETDEARFDWVHTRASGEYSDAGRVEIEKGFGLLTLELAVPFERVHNIPSDTNKAGFGNIEVGARYPIYEYVSAGGVINTTFGAAIEVGIPSDSSLSKNTELVPKIFNDLKIGSHFTIQSLVGYSMLYGGGEEGGLQTFEYGFVFAYSIPHKELPIPGVLQFVPMLELSGGTQLNKDTPGNNSLVGDVGFRVNLKSIGPVSPRLGFGFIFPVDVTAREEMHWGVVTSLVFEY